MRYPSCATRHAPCVTADPRAAHQRTPSFPAVASTRRAALTPLRRLLPSSPLALRPSPSPLASRLSRISSLPLPPTPFPFRASPHSLAPLLVPLCRPSSPGDLSRHPHTALTARAISPRARSSLPFNLRSIFFLAPFPPLTATTHPRAWLPAARPAVLPLAVARPRQPRTVRAAAGGDMGGMAAIVGGAVAVVGVAAVLVGLQRGGESERAGEDDGAAAKVKVRA
ncbi:unnamed protein product [Closterium sp. Naga37s-1]|nr:unnamed protein product [Closterium sp. Naga37s-1]